MRIAVIADTHDRYPSRLLTHLGSADEIWHLGDVCEPGVLFEFEQLGRPMHVVLGNNDAHPFWPLSLDLDRAGKRFHLVHIPPRRAPAGCRIILHGHTHVPRNDTIDGVRWLNPGCISRPNRGFPPSFAWLGIDPGKPLRWELVLL